MAVGSTVLALAVFLLSRHMAGLFAGFGADLPAFTAAVLAIGPFAPFLSLVNYVPAGLLIARRRRFHGEPDSWAKLSVAGFLVFGLLLIGTWVAMYLPIFKLGSVV